MSCEEMVVQKGVFGVVREQKTVLLVSHAFVRVIFVIFVIFTGFEQLSPCFRERLRGWKTQGGGKHTVNSAKNPSPKTFLDPPPTIPFPPLFWRLSVISLKRKRHRPDQPQFLRPPKLVLESTLCSTVSPPPQFHAIRFAPLSAAAQLFCWVDCKFVICAVFVKTPSFWRDKSMVYQKHRFWDPDKVCFLNT